MVEVTPTYSINPADYEYDPNVYHLRHIPGVGIHQFDNNASEENIQKTSDEIALNAELQYANHHKDPVLLDTYKRYSKRKTGEDFTGTDQEAVDGFMSDFAYIDNNLTFGLGKVLIDQTGLSEQDKFDVGLLYDRYERTNATGEGSRPFMDQLADVSYATVTDPINAIGVFTGGIGFAARATVGKVAGQAAKKAIVEGWRNSMLGKFGKGVAKRPVVTAMAEMGAWGATYDIEKQALEIGSGMQEVRHEVTGESESFDYDELLLTTAISAGFGGIIGGGAKAASKFFSKGDYSNLLGKDRSKATTAELRAELKARGFEDPDPNNTTFQYEQAPLIASSKENLIKVNKKFNETQQATQLSLPFGPTGSKTPEADYPIKWANENGEGVDVTVSDIKTPGTAGMEALGFKPDKSSRITEVTLRDKDGIEYKTFTNKEGGLNFPVKQVQSNEQMRKILDTADIKAIREEGESPAGIMKRAHQFLKQNFTSHFGLGPETAERLRDAERALTAAGEKIDTLVKKFENEWEIQTNSSFNDAGRDIHKTFIKALSTADSSKRALDVETLLPKGSKLYEVVEEWRDIIKDTSGELVDSNAFSEYRLDTNGNRMLDEKGNPIKNSFLKTLQKHRKERNYLHSMYSIYEDPEYQGKTLKDRLGEDNYNKIRSHFAARLNGSTDAAEEVMIEIATPSADRKLGKLGPVAKKKLGSIKDKDRDYITTLIGEITDPRQLFAASVFKTKKIVEDYKMKRDLVTIGLRRGANPKPFMARSDIEADWKPINPGKRSFELNDEELNRMWSREAEGLENQQPASFMENPFDGIFVDPEYKMHYDNMASFYDTSTGAFVRTLAASTFAFNLSKTVLSPTTHARNFSGGMLQNAYNGILPWGSRSWRKSVSSEDNKKGSPAYSVFRRAIPLHKLFRERKALSNDDTDSIVRLLELGVLHNGMKAGIFKETYNIMTESVNPLHALEKRLMSGNDSGLIKAVDKASEIYEMSDNINKISAFESEFGWLYRAFGDGANTDEFIKHADALGVFDARQRLNSGKEGILSTLIEEAAAKKVNMFTPTYSQLSGVSRLFRAVPIGNFVAFPMEVTRNYTNSWRLAARELRSGSAAMRTRGSIRAASLAGASAITVGGIGGLSAAINGITDDEREALESKELSSEWLYGTNFFYTGKLKDGTLKAIPLGYTDPFSYLSRIAQVAMHSLSENEEDAVLNSRLMDASWEAFKVAIEPYVIPAVGPATLINTYKELSEAYEQDKEINHEAILRSLDTAFSPTFVKDMYKTDLIPFVDAPKVTKWNTEVDPKWHTMVGWVSGMKPQNINISTKVGFALSDVYRDKSANSTKFNRFVDNPQNFEPSDYRENIVREYKDYIAKEKEIARRVKSIFGHARKLGIEGAKLTDLAISFSKAAKVGEEKAKASFSEEYIKQIGKDKYPISFVSEDILNKIRNTLRKKGVSPGDNLITDLLNVIRQSNKDRIGD